MTSSSAESGLHIGAVAMVTPFGGYHQSCAASRAGFSAVSELELTLLDSEGEEQPARGAEVTCARGFDGDARLVELALPAFQRIVGAVACPTAGLVLALPDRGQEDALPVLARLRGAVPGVDFAEKAEFRGGLRTLVNALDTAQTLLGQGKVSVCILGCVDSRVGITSLRELVESRRLKTDATPAGLLPGEAAVFVSLTHAPPTGPGGGHTGVRLANWSAVKAEQPRASRRQALKEIRAHAPMAREWWLSDHNGEEPRAREWGESLVLRPGLAPVAVTHTAMSFGDTGLVACLLSVALATRALERGYALTDRALCFGAGDDGSRGLLEVERHP